LVIVTIITVVTRGTVVGGRQSFFNLRRSDRAFFAEPLFGAIATREPKTAARPLVTSKAAQAKKTAATRSRSALRGFSFACTALSTNSIQGVKSQRMCEKETDSEHMNKILAGAQIGRITSGIDPDR